MGLLLSVRPALRLKPTAGCLTWWFLPCCVRSMIPTRNVPMLTSVHPMRMAPRPNHRFFSY